MPQKQNPSGGRHEPLRWCGGKHKISLPAFRQLVRAVRNQAIELEEGMFIDFPPALWVSTEKLYRVLELGSREALRGEHGIHLGTPPGGVDCCCLVARREQNLSVNPAEVIGLAQWIALKLPAAHEEYQKQKKVDDSIHHGPRRMLWQRCQTQIWRKPCAVTLSVEERVRAKWLRQFVFLGEDVPLRLA